MASDPLQAVPVHWRFCCFLDIISYLHYWLAGPFFFLSAVIPFEKHL